MAHLAIYLAIAGVTAAAGCYCLWESVDHRRKIAHARAAHRLSDAAYERDIARFRAQLADYENAQAVIAEAAAVVETHLADITDPQEGGPQ